MGISDNKQCVGEAFRTYLMERVDGGVGMIILENTRVDDKHGGAAQVGRIEGGVRQGFEITYTL